MEIIDIEVGLTDEEREIRDVTHKFAAEVLRPAGAELDRLADPSDVIAADSVFRSHSASPASRPCSRISPENQS